MGEEKELMKRQNILLIVFAVLLAAAACAYFFVIRPAVADTGDADTAEPAETEPGENLSSSGSIFMFAGMSREDVEYIKVDNAYGTFKFTASGTDGTDFVIDGYDNVPYDKNLFASLLNVATYTLSKTKVGSSLSDAKLEEYGLTEPQASWTVLSKSGQAYRVFVGDRLLTGGGYYCMVEGRRSVYVLGTEVADTVLVPIESYVTPVVCAGISKDDYYTTDNFTVFKNGELLLRMKLKDKKDQINKNALAENIMVYPTAYIPDSTLYYDIIYSYMGLYADSCYKLGASDADFAAVGLDDPAHVITFDYKGYEFEIFFSARDGEGNYYMYNNMYPNVIGKCGGDTYDYLEYDLIDWIDPYLFQQYITNLSEISVGFSGKTTNFKLYHGTDDSGNATLAVSADGEMLSQSAADNFRQYYKTLLAFTAQGYCKDDEFCTLGEDELASLAADTDAADLTFSYTTLSGETTVFRFYRYSTRHSLITVNGVGEFYTLTDLVKKIESDTGRLLGGEDIIAYDKS